MTTLKCKICGGNLLYTEGARVAECEACGTLQTLPRLDDDRRTALFDRANHFRRNSEFDKAAGIYETVLNEDTKDSEAYWSLVLCRFGITYVKDPATGKHIPTVNRAQKTSVFSDENYKAAIDNAAPEQKVLYEEEARTIDGITKRILEISAKEDPYDIFISYKETGADGERTIDSVYATDIYNELTKVGYKVFLSRITLESMIGKEYEPVIFAAINSSRVMIVVGTKPEHFNAVWVKNEWSRYLALIKSGENKTLIPVYKDMDAYDLPDEFTVYQGSDMSKIGFMQDLVMGVKKLIDADKPKAGTAPAGAAVNSVKPLLERVFMFLEDEKWDDANKYCEKVLDIEPKNADAYLGKLMAELKINRKENLKYAKEPFDRNGNAIKAAKFNPEYAKKFNEDNYIIRERNEQARIQSLYDRGVNILNRAEYEGDFLEAADFFAQVEGYKDSSALRQKSIEYADIARRKAAYNDACGLISKDQIESNEGAIKLFEEADGYADSAAKIEECRKNIAAINAAAARAKKKQLTIKLIKVGLVAAVVAFILLLKPFIIPFKSYREANQLVNVKRFSAAYALYNQYPEFLNTEKKLSSAKLKHAQYLIERGEYDLLKNIIVSEDDPEELKEALYNEAESLVSKGANDGALMLYGQLYGYKDSVEKFESLYKKVHKKTYDKVSKLKVGDKFKFGKYVREDNDDNGALSMEWIVLEKQDHRLLVISKSAVECVRFNLKKRSVAWYNCTLRNWLNSEFLENSFSLAECELIRPVTVQPETNPHYEKTKQGYKTADKLFVLSVSEVKKYFPEQADRTAKMNSYLLGKHNSASLQGNSIWWVRNSGQKSKYACAVGSDGILYTSGYKVDEYYVDVRPVMWLEY